MNGIEIGEERTFEHDLAYAIRLLVDIAIRALSPGESGGSAPALSGWPCEVALSADRGWQMPVRAATQSAG